MMKYESLDMTKWSPTGACAQIYHVRVQSKLGYLYQWMTIVSGLDTWTEIDRVV